MTITVSEELNAEQLVDRLWSGAQDTMQKIIDAGKEETFFAIVQDMYCDKDSIDLTSLNDLLRFEEDTVMEWLGLNEDEDKEWYIDDEEFETLKANGVLSEAHIKVIQESFDCGFHAITAEELINEEELSDEEIEELNTVVA